MRRIFLSLLVAAACCGCATTNVPTLRDAQNAARDQALSRQFHLAARTLLGFKAESPFDRMICLLGAADYYAAADQRALALGALDECARMSPSSTNAQTLRGICANKHAAFARGDLPSVEDVLDQAREGEKREQRRQAERHEAEQAVRDSMTPSGSYGTAGGSTSGSKSRSSSAPSSARCRPREVVCGVNQVCEPLPPCKY